MKQNLEETRRNCKAPRKKQRGISPTRRRVITLHYITRKASEGPNVERGISRKSRENTWVGIIIMLLGNADIKSIKESRKIIFNYCL